jgi:hypothetical protein
VDREGKEHNTLAYALDMITSNIEKTDIKSVSGLFPGISSQDLERPAGPVDLLLGLNYSSLHPVPHPDYTGDLRLLNSHFGTGLLLDGWHGAVNPVGIKINHLVGGIDNMVRSKPTCPPPMGLCRRTIQDI